MPFRPVRVTTIGGEFVGFSIKHDDASKLHTLNLWNMSQEDRDDLNAQVERLNAKQTIDAAWPTPDDPDVQALFNDPTFAPARLVDVEVMDEDLSVVRFLKEPDDDHPHGIMDEEASHIVMKTVSVPSPTAWRERLRAAMAHVAQERANA